MEDPQRSANAHHLDTVQPIRQGKPTPSVSTSPEHSRSRPKKARDADQPLDTGSRLPPRRRESYADGTRRGRSRTRSVSPGSVQRRAMRRRRSRSPSRSCSTSATETQSSNVKRRRRCEKDQAKDEHAGADLPEVVARDASRESMRSRSKRRKKYRRRSDYAAAVGDIALGTELKVLRDVSSVGFTDLNEEVLYEGRAPDTTKSFDSSLEED